jgi:NADPH:quinone reductase-like Zn-dependent oxidoreductase
MQGLVLSTVDSPPVFQTVTKPEPGPGQVRIKLAAAALNRRDVWIMRGKYPGIRTPVILGSDGCGVVDAVGDGVDSLPSGRVILNPSMHWGDSLAHQSLKYQILGLPKNGTFAEYVVLPARNVHAAPAHLSDVEAAALPLAGLTAYRALVTRAQLKAGEKVLITGIGGGVAIKALQIALALGASEVWVTSSRDAAIEQAVALGAAGGVKYTDEDWSRQLQRKVPTGFDVIVDSAGGEGFGGLIRVAGMGGRIVFFGGTVGKWPRILPQYLFFKQISILGTTMGGDAEFADLLALVAKTGLRPVVSDVRPLADGASAFLHLEASRQIGKVVLTCA